MDRERHGITAQKLFSGIFALVVAAIVLLMVAFVARRTGELRSACDGGVDGEDISEVCGEEKNNEWFSF